MIDFFPPRLEEFAVSHRVTEYEALSDDSGSGSERSVDCSGSDDEPGSNGRKWEWRFYLLLEDAGRTIQGEAKARIKVLVADKDAEFLLKMDAENLRRNPTALSALREKLFILWGDLEERKSRGDTALTPRDPNASISLPPTRPFTCCIKEYGVRYKRQDINAESGEEKDDEDDICNWERRFRMSGTTIS